VRLGEYLCAAEVNRAPKADKRRNFEKFSRDREILPNKEGPKARSLSLNKAVPKTHLLILGTKLKKAIRIQAVIIRRNPVASRFTLHASLLM
jgi:hypothetical protein